jgi:alpha-glucoside transport system substrate-binding protein
MIGRTLGSYRIVERIGRGGMASVYKAYDPGTDRYVALKVLPEHMADDPQFLARFEREAKAIARLEHPRILPVHAFGEEEGTTYLVMRYLPTGTLAEYIHQRPLPLEEASRILTQIAEGLDYAHLRGVLHRDVKPSNVLLDENGNAYLTDFGIAKIVEANAQLTGTGTLLGTPAYMSPEQCMGSRDLTEATDIYSLGIVTYEMLVGHTPFEAETPIAVIHMQLHDPLPPPRSLRPDLPEAVERVLLKALAKEPEMRYETCGDMARAFSQAIEEPVVQSPYEPAPTLVESPTAVREQEAPAPSVPVPEVPTREDRVREGRARGGGGLPLKTIGIVLAVIVCLGGLAAGGIFLLPGVLGGGGAGRGQEPTAAAEVAAREEEPPAEPTPLPEREVAPALAGTRVFVMGKLTDGAQANFENALRPFEEQTGITVEYVYEPGFEQVMQVRAESGELPDLAIFPQPGLLKALYLRGHALPLTSIVDEGYLRARYRPSWIDIATVDGQIVGFWYDASIKSLVWYPVPEFYEADYPIPENWEEMLALSERMVADGRTPWCIGFESGDATGWVGTDWIEDVMLRTAPLEVYDAWVSGDLPFNSLEVRRAFETSAQIWFNDAFVRGGRDAILNTFFIDALYPMFDNPPGCWLHRQGSFTPSLVPEGNIQGEDYDFFYLPPIDPAFGRPILGAGDIIGVFDDRPEVRELVYYLTSPEAAQRLIEPGRFISPLNEVDLDWYPSEADRRYAELLYSTDSFRFDASDQMPVEVYEAFWAGIMDFVSGADLDQVLSNIDAAWPR